MEINIIKSFIFLVISNEVYTKIKQKRLTYTGTLQCSHRENNVRHTFFIPIIPIAYFII